MPIDLSIKPGIAIAWMHHPLCFAPGLNVAIFNGPTTDSWGEGGLAPTSLPVRRGRRAHLVRALWMGCSLGVIIYSIAVLCQVAWMGTIGVRCMFGTEVEEEISSDYAWPDGTPRVGDELLSIGRSEIAPGVYADYIQALRDLRQQVGKTIAVRWRDRDSQAIHSAQVTVQYPPARTYFWSWIWFMQELLILAIGARVYWKRPNDDSARLFFILCIMTAGAFMGGYHWTEIVVQPLLIYLFAVFALFVPVVMLHFYLVFPRANPFFLRHRRGVLRWLYGATTAYLSVLMVGMLTARWFVLHQGGRGTAMAFATVRWLALGYIAIAVAIFGVCILCLISSFRHAKTRRRAEPGPMVSARRGTRRTTDRLPDDPGLERSGDAGTRQFGLAHVRRVAPVHCRACR